MPAPAIVQPPGAPNLFGPPNGDTWTLTTQTQNRPQVRKISYDPRTGAEVARSGFADKHLIDRVVHIGIAWHEGQILGRINQLIRSEEQKFELQSLMRTSTAALRLTTHISD